MPAALRALLAGVVDYAGLFPPASLSMREACGNFLSYSASSDSWMLGGIVVPVARLSELEREIVGLTRRREGAEDERPGFGAASLNDETQGREGRKGATLRVVAILSADVGADLERVRVFNGSSDCAVIDVVEGKVGSDDDVRALASQVPAGVTAYCEVGVASDPVEVLRAVKAAGLRAKVRTGGVVAEAIPAAADVVRFLRRCHELGVTAKATAGLHHPLRAEYPLTYEAGAARGVMYGYLNVLLCAAVIAVGGSDVQAAAVLEAGEGRAREWFAGFKGSESLNFKGSELLNGVKGTESAPVASKGTEILIGGEGVEKLIVLDADVLARVRRDALVGFGSCSFREPVDELRALLARAGSVEPA